MENKELKNTELETLKSELEVSELEERLEMVNAASAAAERCCNDGCNNGCAGKDLQDAV